MSQKQFPWLSAKNISFAGCDIRALRVSYIGESGWELHVRTEYLGKIYDAVVNAGEEFDLGYYGAYAANSMRLEKGYRAWGLDFTTERTPLEAGAERFTKKPLRVRPASDWHMQLLSLDTAVLNADAFSGHSVFCGDRCVGVVTSGSYGARVKQSLALVYLREPIESLDKPLSVELLGEHVAARILTEVPYDPTNLRMKSLETPLSLALSPRGEGVYILG